LLQVISTCLGHYNRSIVRTPWQMIRWNRKCIYGYETSKHSFLLVVYIT
jgi:hypothetical protein